MERELIYSAKVDDCELPFTWVRVWLEDDRSTVNADFGWKDSIHPQVVGKWWRDVLFVAQRAVVRYREQHGRKP